MTSTKYAIGALALSILSFPSLAATFVPLGHLPGGTYSAAYAVSADGSVIVGPATVDSPDATAFQWTSEGGISEIPGSTGPGYASLPFAVSGNGAVIAGASGISGSERAAVWTSADGWTLLPGAGTSEALGISTNGTVIVGWWRPPGGNNIAVRWSDLNSNPIGLGSLPFASQIGGQANAVSADGNVIVGSAASYGNRGEAFRWTAAGGMVGLGSLGPGNSTAFGTSSDGAVVVGVWISDVGDRVAFRWTQQTGMVGLGDLPGGEIDGWGIGVSGDGATIVGFGDRGNGRESFLWTEQSGMVPLLDFLLANGAANVQGWILREARAISVDGHVVVGEAINPQGQPEAFAAILAPVPVPAAVWLFFSAVGVLALSKRSYLPVIEAN